MADIDVTIDASVLFLTLFTVVTSVFYGIQRLFQFGALAAYENMLLGAIILFSVLGIALALLDMKVSSLEVGAINGFSIGLILTGSLMPATMLSGAVLGFGILVGLLGIGKTVQNLMN